MGRYHCDEYSNDEHIEESISLIGMIMPHDMMIFAVNIFRKESIPLNAVSIIGVTSVIDA